MPTHSHSLPAAAPPLRNTAAGGGAQRAAMALSSDDADPEISAAQLAAQLLAAPGADARRREQAADLLARHHWRRMVRSAQGRFGLEKPDAEDAVQNTFLKFLRRCPVDCVVPEAYLFTVFANCCRDVHRQHGRRIGWPQLDHPIGDPDDGQVLELPAPLALTNPMLLSQWRQITRAVVETILAQTPGRVLVMSAIVDGLPDADIARRLGIGPNPRRSAPTTRCPMPPNLTRCLPTYCAKACRPNPSLWTLPPMRA